MTLNSVTLSFTATMNPDSPLPLATMRYEDWFRLMYPHMIQGDVE